MRVTTSGARPVAGLAAALLAAAVLAGCSGGGGERETPTPPERVPSVEEISALVGQGFVGEKIDYTQTLVSAFRSPTAIIDRVKLCGAPAPAAAQRGADFWPVLLGDCYFAGNATMRLYQFTHRSEFLDANRLIERLHAARVREATADGLKLDDRYWTTVTRAIYDVAYNPATPTAARVSATPPP